MIEALFNFYLSKEFAAIVASPDTPGIKSDITNKPCLAVLVVKQIYNVNIKKLLINN